MHQISDNGGHRFMIVFKSAEEEGLIITYVYSTDGEFLAVSIDMLPKEWRVLLGMSGRFQILAQDSCAFDFPYRDPFSARVYTWDSAEGLE